MLFSTIQFSEESWCEQLPAHFTLSCIALSIRQFCCIRKELKERFHESPWKEGQLWTCFLPKDLIKFLPNLPSMVLKTKIKNHNQTEKIDTSVSFDFFIFRVRGLCSLKPSGQPHPVALRLPHPLLYKDHPAQQWRKAPRACLSCLALYSGCLQRTRSETRAEHCSRQLASFSLDGLHQILLPVWLPSREEKPAHRPVSSHGWEPHELDSALGRWKLHIFGRPRSQDWRVMESLNVGRDPAQNPVVQTFLPLITC